MYAWVGRLFRRYLELSRRRPWLMLAVITVVSVGLLLYGSKLKVRGDLEDLFPEDTPAVQRAKETRKLLGNTQELRVLIGSKDRELNRQLAEQVASFASQREDVSRVDFRRDVSFFEKNGILFVSVEDLQELEQQVTDAIAEAVKSDLGLDEGFEDEEEEKPAAPSDGKPGEEKEPEEAKSKLPTVEEVKKKHKVEGFNEFFESPDGEVIGVKIYPKFRVTDATKTEVLNTGLEAELNRLIAPHAEAGVSWVMDGDYSQVTRAAAQIMDDMATSGIWSLVGIALVVIAFFRRVRALLVVLLVLGISTAWMMAFAQLSVGYLNLVTSIIFAILFGMGVDFVIHALARVDEEHRHGVDLDQAVSRGFLGLARPVFNAMLTTAVTFWALIVFDFRGFSQLGLIAGFGVAFALLALYLLYPPLANAMNRIWKVKPRKKPLIVVDHDDGAETSHVRGLATSPPVSRGKKRFAWAIVVAVVGLGGASAFVASELPFGSDMGKFRVKDNQAENTLKTKYKQAETRSTSPVLIVTQDLAQTERAHRFLEAHLDRYPIVNEVSSVFAFIPEQQDEKLAIVKEIKRKIDNKYGALEGQTKADADELRRYLEPAAFGPEQLPDWVKARFTDTEGRFGRYLLLFTKGQKSDALVALETFRQVGTVALPAAGDLPAVELTSSASFYISGEAYAIVKREGPWAAVIGLVVVVFVVLFDFRSPRELLMILSPILSGFSITLGLMTLLDVPLDLFNVVVLPQIFGIGIDTGTHLTHRIKEGGPHVVQNVRATAIAAGISSSLTAIGFASLLPVSNAGLQSIGLVAVMGIGISYVVNVLMFTAFQWILRPKAA